MEVQKGLHPHFSGKCCKVQWKIFVYISDKELVNNSIIESEDCESWQIQIELDKAYRESIKNIIIECLIMLSLQTKS